MKILEKEKEKVLKKQCGSLVLKVRLGMCSISKAYLEVVIQVKMETLSMCPKISPLQSNRSLSKTPFVPESNCNIPRGINIPVPNSMAFFAMPHRMYFGPALAISVRCLVKRFEVSKRPDRNVKHCQ